MVTSTDTVYLVTGANRGIGFGLVASLATRENVLVFATARDPSKATDLNKLAKETGKVVVLKLDSTSEADAHAAAKLVEERAGKVDAIIANAGQLDSFGKAPEEPVENYIRLFTVNALGPLILFKVFSPLLYKSSTRKVAVVSSALGSLTLAYPIPTTAYATSKAAVNFIFRKIHGEEVANNLTSFVLNPGYVWTDATRNGVDNHNMPTPSLTVEESAMATLKLVDEATRETHGGKFFDYTGEEIPW
ncbi:hypothetical protein JCM11641_003967 [Rhodosporidiobolus odoratus]